MKKVINKNVFVEDNNINLDTLAKNSIYSTEEIVVGKWNNKSLYRKTVYATLDCTPAVTNKSVGIVHSISNIEECFCDYTHSYILWNGRTFTFGNGQWQSGSNAYQYAINFSANKNDVSFYLGTWNVTYSGNIKVCVTIEYTKTTD